MIELTKCGRCGGTDERPNPHCEVCSPWSRTLTCCYLAPVEGEGRVTRVSCGEVAAFEVFATRGAVRGIAGPDIYSDTTYACEAHVGALLGYQPEAARPEEIFWQVRPIGARQELVA